MRVRLWRQEWKSAEEYIQHPDVVYAGACLQHELGEHRQEFEEILSAEIQRRIRQNFKANAALKQREQRVANVHKRKREAELEVEELERQLKKLDGEFKRLEKRWDEWEESIKL